MSVILFPGVCSFDSGFCQWRNEGNEDQFDWSITEGETPSKGTGPLTGFGGSGIFGALVISLVIMYMKKLRASDWLKTSAFSCDTIAKL